MNDGLKSRKLWYCIVSGAVFTYLQVSGKLPADGVTYANLMFSVLGALTVGNGIDKFAARSRP